MALVIAKVMAAEQRQTDVHGSGAFEAPRSYGKHHGIDYVAAPGDLVLASYGGVVTRCPGTVYANDFYTYIEITDGAGNRARYYYINIRPNIVIGQEIVRAQVLGYTQDLTLRYPGITNHIHFEIKRPAKPVEYLNPEEY